MPVLSVGEIPDGYIDNPYCQAIAGLPGIKNLVLLPDVHIKAKYKRAGYMCVVPSSSVTASEPTHLYPQIRSRGIGCGMALWPLGVHNDEVSTTRLEGFAKAIYGTLRSRRPLATRIDDITGRFVPRTPNVSPPGQYGLSRSSWQQSLRDGARAYLQAHGLGQHAPNFEEGGNHLGTAEQAALEQHADIIGTDARGSRDFSGGDYRAGLWLRGNHYMELQKVDTVYDADLLASSGVTPNELVLMNHSCGWGLEFLFTEQFAQRRIRLPEFRSIQPSESDFGVVRMGTALLKNLGGIRRAIFLRRAVDAAAVHLPEASMRLLCECNHNDIEFGDDEIIYRHNALRLRPNAFQIISGNYNHPSYLITSGPRSGDTYRTVGHGLGQWLKDEVAFEPDPVRSVARLGLEQPKGLRRLKTGPTDKRKDSPLHRGDPGDRLLHSLAKAGVIRLVAKLTPRLSVSHEW
jgi:hypothetical protein